MKNLFLQISVTMLSKLQLINKLLAKDSPFMIPFSRSHFQILFSIIASQLLQKIYKHVYHNTLIHLLELTIPSPWEESRLVVFFRA